MGMRVSSVGPKTSTIRPETSKVGRGLRTVFANPKFHLGRVVKYGGIFAGIMSLFLGWWPGIVPTLAVGLLWEGVRGRKKNAPPPVDVLANEAELQNFVNSQPKIDNIV